MAFDKTFQKKKLNIFNSILFRMIIMTGTYDIAYINCDVTHIVHVRAYILLVKEKHVCNRYNVIFI